MIRAITTLIHKETKSNLQPIMIRGLPEPQLNARTELTVLAKADAELAVATVE